MILAPKPAERPFGSHTTLLFRAVVPFHADPARGVGVHGHPKLRGAGLREVVAT